MISLRASICGLCAGAGRTCRQWRTVFPGHEDLLAETVDHSVAIVAVVGVRDLLDDLLVWKILELQDELDRASSTITASTGEAHSRGEKVADLERSLRHEKRRAEEVSGA